MISSLDEVSAPKVAVLCVNPRRMMKKVHLELSKMDIECYLRALHKEIGLPIPEKDAFTRTQ